MKNVLTLLFLTFCNVVASGQIIDFPDPKFKNALVNTKCVDIDGDGDFDSSADFNKDGEIDIEDALKVKRLYLSFNNIIDLEGINFFSNIEVLSCGSNKISKLILNNLTNLRSLRCEANSLEVLILENTPNLFYLDCNQNKIKSLILNQVVNLIELNFSRNELTYLNVSGLKNIKNINCSQNKLSKLDLSGLSNLEYLNCSYNSLESLNTEDLTNLKSLYCNQNLLKSLSIINKKELNYLFCNRNKIINLELKGLTKLGQAFFNNNMIIFPQLENLPSIEELDLAYNKVDSIILENLLNIKILKLSNNSLKYVDASQLINLTWLDMPFNKLTYANIKTGRSLSFSFAGNNNLKYICCNENEIQKFLSQGINYGFKYEVNAYCSFTPGGKFYTIQGQNTYDENINGCDDKDIKIPNVKYNITNGIMSGTFISNSTGNYSIPIQEGTHTITPILEHPNHFEASPSSFTVTFPTTSDTITQNFCITPKDTFRQTNITVIPLTPPARPGFDASYKIVWENVGNQIENGTLNFTYDETLLDYISATQTADQLADGIIKWNFTNLLPFEKREITVTLKVNRPTDTPAVNAGDKLYLTASILDNIFTLENTVVGSYDPNDKTCLQGDRVKPDMVGEYVDYLIRFENTGNYAAENVVVKDIIDTKTFDVSSLQITDASHEVYTRIEGNKVEFIFENIQLPFDDANNDGYIAFKIKNLPSLVLGDSLKNLADIYFDYNFPIRTNEAQTTIALPSITKDFNTEVNVYPNPVKDILYFETNENWSKAEIYDIAGRIIRYSILNGQSIDVSGLESGTYFVRLKDGEKVGLVRFVKI